MSDQSDHEERMKHVYSGWPIPAHEKPPQPRPEQLDIEAEIERRVAERLAGNVVDMPKKKKKAEEPAE